MRSEECGVDGQLTHLLCPLFSLAKSDWPGPYLVGFSISCITSVACSSCVPLARSFPDISRPPDLDL